MTMPASERERIRQYLVEQAASKGTEELIERVEEGMRELRAAALAIPPERYGDRPRAMSGARRIASATWWSGTCGWRGRCCTRRSRGAAG
ncbi:hypothetical protein O0235_00430 [Tepidiforma flava]|uniref:Uncharacterized protein n=1 Tax=Tepidiforma flava TaxID=3004094 RepID=A0ABY7M6G4_9CHLR|nr:hypothetical protein [Tepidiforma flava]WBL36127.1 hypothetical protein O0235_00430 [Tepidiforma flava]